MIKNYKGLNDIGENLKKTKNPILMRLINELIQDNKNFAKVYNRTHNRHNRGR